MNAAALVYFNHLVYFVNSKMQRDLESFVGDTDELVVILPGGC